MQWPVTRHTPIPPLPLQVAQALLIIMYVLWPAGLLAEAMLYQAMDVFSDQWQSDSNWVDLREVIMLSHCATRFRATASLPCKCVLDWRRFVDPPVNEVVHYPAVALTQIGSHSLRIRLPTFAAVRGRGSTDPN